jgi:hypothetical protein
MAASIQKRLEKVLAESKAIIDTLKQDTHYFIAEKEIISGSLGLATEKRRVLMKPGAEAIAKAKDLTAEFSDPIVILSSPANPNSSNVVVRCHMKDKSGKHIASGMGSYETISVPFNTAIKMASKSAFIDATIRAASLSDAFTQDIMPDAGGVMTQATQVVQSVAKQVAQNQVAPVKSDLPLEGKQKSASVVACEVSEPTPAARELIDWIKANIPHAGDIPVLFEARDLESMTVEQLEGAIDDWHGVVSSNPTKNAEDEKSVAEPRYDAGGLLGGFSGEMVML